MRNRVMWIPLVLVGSFLYWTTALGLGGLSLTFLGNSQDCDGEEELALEPTPPTVETETPAGSEEPIVVHLESWSDRAAGGADGDDGTASLPAADDANEPGQTSY
jgi:hypothetical protein